MCVGGRLRHSYGRGAAISAGPCLRQGALSLLTRRSHASRKSGYASRGQNTDPNDRSPLHTKPSSTMQSFFNSIMRPVRSSIRRSTRFFTRNRFPQAAVSSSENRSPRWRRAVVQRLSDLVERPNLDELPGLEAELLASRRGLRRRTSACRDVARADGPSCATQISRSHDAEEAHDARRCRSGPRATYCHRDRGLGPASDALKCLGDLTPEDLFWAGRRTTVIARVRAVANARSLLDALRRRSARRLGVVCVDTLGSTSSFQ